MIKQYEFPGALAALRKSDEAWARMTETQRQNFNGRASHAVERWAEAGGTAARPAVVQVIIRNHKKAMFR